MSYVIKTEVDINAGFGTSRAGRPGGQDEVADPSARASGV